MKALVKSIEEFPERYKCCAAGTAFIKALACGLIIDVTPHPNSRINPCPHCGAAFIGIKLFMVNGDPRKAIPVDCVHLDEGEIN